MASGVITSAGCCTLHAPPKPRGFTPTIVSTASFSFIVWPMACGERANSRSHMLSLITAIAPEPGTASSAGSIGRPNCGRTPNCW